MSNYLKEAGAIIRKNANLVNDSLITFIVKCFEDADSCEEIDLYISLYKVLTKAMGSWSDIVDKIVNGEGYCKWKTLDQINKEEEYSRGKSVLETGEYTMFRWIFTKFLSIAEREGYDDVLNTPLPIDFSCDPSIYKDYDGLVNMPIPVINSDYKTPYTVLYSTDLPEDLYSGLIVPRSKFPQASASELNKHHWASLILDYSDKGITYAYRSDIETNNVMGYWIEKCTYDDVGLMYVPTAHLAQSLIDNNNLGRLNLYDAPFRTILPKHICDKYNLPIGDIK